MIMDKTGLYSLYSYPFYIDRPAGNNIFSFEKRESKTIHIPAMIESSLKDIKESETYAFIEYEETEIKCKGLNRFIRHDKIFLFDNHNHSYFFYKAYLEEKNLSHLNFVHVDQHKDLREPEIYCEEFQDLKINAEFELLSLGLTLEQVKNLKKSSFFDLTVQWFLYTNLILNVGNFIRPLISENKINNLYIIDSENSMDNLDFDKLGDFALDLDLDFFSKDMDYIDFNKKIKFVQRLVDRAAVIFIATSPYFLEYEEAKKVLKSLKFRH